MTPEEIRTIKVNQLRMVNTGWRKESFPKRLLTGRNWGFDRSGVVIDFSYPEPKSYPVEPNDPDTDSCIEWMDGYVSVLRTENEPTFRDSPPRLGKARAGTGTKARGNGSKKRRKR